MQGLLRARGRGRGCFRSLGAASRRRIRAGGRVPPNAFHRVVGCDRRVDRLERVAVLEAALLDELEAVVVSAAQAGGSPIVVLRGASSAVIELN